jgi:hypothetical protein
MHGIVGEEGVSSRVWPPDHPRESVIPAKEGSFVRGTAPEPSTAHHHVRNGRSLALISMIAHRSVHNIKVPFFITGAAYSGALFLTTDFSACLPEQTVFEMTLSRNYGRSDAP